MSDVLLPTRYSEPLSAASPGATFRLSCRAVAVRACGARRHACRDVGSTSVPHGSP
jgi:hypothetical protein